MVGGGRGEKIRKWYNSLSFTHLSATGLEDFFMSNVTLVFYEWELYCSAGEQYLFLAPWCPLIDIIFHLKPTCRFPAPQSTQNLANC